MTNNYFLMSSIYRRERFEFVVPFFDVNERLSFNVRISIRPVEELKRKMRHIEHDIVKTRRKTEHRKSKTSCTWSTSQSTGEIIIIIRCSNTITIGNPLAASREKQMNAGRPSSTLTRQQH